MFLDVENVVLDHHYYQVRNIEGNNTSLFTLGYKTESEKADNVKYDVWFGEWSLATDICA